MKNPSIQPASSPSADFTAVFASSRRPSALVETVAGPGAAIVVGSADAVVIGDDFKRTAEVSIAALMV